MIKEKDKETLFKAIQEKRSGNKKDLLTLISYYFESKKKKNELNIVEANFLEKINKCELLQNEAAELEDVALKMTDERKDIRGTMVAASNSLLKNIELYDAMQEIERHELIN